MEGKHTATPWTTQKDGKPELRNQNNLIEGANGELVAYAQLTDADAAFIVRACNAHDDLVAAVHHALTHEDGPSVRDVLRAALSKAGGLPDIAGAA